MKIVIPLLLLIFINSSCSKDNNNREVSSKTVAQNQANIPTNLLEPSSKETVEQFYNWYLRQVYIPYLDHGKPNLYQPEIKQKFKTSFSLDTIQYFNLLKNQPFFSKNFIANERDIIAACNKELKNIN